MEWHNPRDTESRAQLWLRKAMDHLPGGFWMVLVLGAVLWFLFRPSFSSKEMVVFSNDGPLGSLQAEQSNPLETFDGVYEDLNWLGEEAPPFGPDVSYGLKVFCCLAQSVRFWWIAPAAAAGFLGFLLREKARGRDWRDRGRRIFAAGVWLYALGMSVGLLAYRGNETVLTLLLQLSGLVLAAAIIVGMTLITK